MRIFAVLIDVSFQKSRSRAAIVWQAELLVFKLKACFHSHRNNHRIRSEELCIRFRYIVALFFKLFPWARFLGFLFSWNRRDGKIGKNRGRLGKNIEKIVEIFGNFGNERFAEAFSVFLKLSSRKRSSNTRNLESRSNSGNLNRFYRNSCFLIFRPEIIRFQIYLDRTLSWVMRVLSKFWVSGSQISWRKSENK